MKSRLEIIADYRPEPECGFWHDADDDECPVLPVRQFLNALLLARADQATVLFWRQSWCK